ncbi:hypothetical protein IAT38_002466 [Cryptococcus sp. DSM 104549]
MSRSATFLPTSATPLLQPSRPSSNSPSHHRLFRRRRQRAHPALHFLPILFPVILFAAVAFLAWDVSSLGNCWVGPLCRVLGDGRGVEQGWYRNQGPYAPYRKQGRGGGTTGLPRGCEVDQVTLLHRHTARYPTTSAGKCMLGALGKIKNREIKAPRHHQELSFLTKADLELKDWVFDGLMDQGRKAAWISGEQVATTYKSFLDKAEGVYTRSSGGGRVVESSGYWLEGFRRNHFKIVDTSELPSVDVVIPETSSSNNTLSVHSCPAFESLSPSPGAIAQQSLHPLLTPALDRLNNVLRPHPPLEPDELVCLADMCGYDSQAHRVDWGGWSKWCGVFSLEEWEVLGYGKDLKRYYEVGEGSEYGPTMGAGYINEIIARLTDSEPRDSTIVNRTLDADERTFPRGGRRLFVDFGHDNEMLEIFAALGILKQHRPLQNDTLPAKRTFILSQIVPFGAKFVVERVKCDTGYWEPEPGEEGGGEEGGRDGMKDYVRVLVNDKVHSIQHIACEQSGLAEHGLCELESFIESQYWATDAVDWGVCYPSDEGSEDDHGEHGHGDENEE